jgi:TetR/AcrR family transcriptional regulator
MDGKLSIVATDMFDPIESVSPGHGPRRPGRQTAAVANQTNQAILGAALVVFSRNGFEAAGLRDIAVLADVTHASIRHHFGSKEGLWLAVVDHAVARYTAALDEQLAPDRAADSVEIMRDTLRSLLGISAASPEIARLLLSEGVEGGTRLDYILEQLISSQSRMTPLLERVQELGYLTQFSNRTFLLFVLLMGDGPFALPALVRALTGQDVHAPEFLDLHVTMVTDTLLPPDGIRQARPHPHVCGKPPTRA